MSGTETYEVKGADLREDLGEDSNQGRRITFNYRQSEAVPAEMKEILSQFDITKDGTVTGKELIAAAHAMEQMKSQAHFMKKLVGMLVITMCLLVACVFASTIGAIEMTKEVVVDRNSQNVLKTPSGENVQVESTDMAVSDGTLVAKTGDGERRLAPSTPVRTASAEKLAVNEITTIRDEDGEEEEGEFCLPCAKVRDVAKRFSEGWAGPFTAATDEGEFAFTVTGWSANVLSVKGQGVEAKLYYDEDDAEETCCGTFARLDETFDGDQNNTDSDSGSRRLSVYAMKVRKYAYCPMGSWHNAVAYPWKADGVNGLRYNTDSTIDVKNIGMPYIVQMHWCMMELAEAFGNKGWARKCRVFDKGPWGRKSRDWACPSGMSTPDPCENSVSGMPDIKEYNRWVGVNDRKGVKGIVPCMGYIGHCFPATAQVRLQDGSTKTLEELGPSDLVETTADFQERGFERWLFDFHGSMGERQAVVVTDFVEIVHEAETPLRITPNHFLYSLRDGEPTLVLAGSVVVGDVLLVTTDAGVKPSIISSLRMVKDRGIYAPLTFSGRLAVNGVVVSSYAASSSTMAAAWQLHQSLPWEKMLAFGSAPFRYFFGYHVDSAFSRIMPAWSNSVLPSMITDPQGRTNAATTVWSKLLDVTLWRWMAKERSVRAGEKLATTLHTAEGERAEGLLAEGCDIGKSNVRDSQSTISKGVWLHGLDALGVTSSHSGLR